MNNVLVDPYSAVYSAWRGPSKGWVHASFQDLSFGYKVCVDVNAKNQMGGYTGSKIYEFVINNGKVVQELGGYNWGTNGANEIVQICSDVPPSPPK